MYLDDATFRAVVSSTPLVSIDLVIRDAEGRVLLGKRKNRPAQYYWFVPGGRVFKNEPLAIAFSRLIEAELGITQTIDHARFSGVYDHFYSDSIWGDCVSTHYVVTAFEILMADISTCEKKQSEIITSARLPVLSLEALPNKQHTDYRWFSVDELLGSSCVHEHTRWYFTRDKGYK